MDYQEGGGRRGVNSGASRGKENVPLTQCQTVLFFGQQAFSCNASGQDGTGWGACYKGYLCFGVWSNDLIQALASGLISITHLQLAVCDIAMVVRATYQQDRTSLPVVLQNGNTAVIDAINRGRAKNAPFASMLKTVMYLAELAGDCYVAAPLHGDGDMITDKLSKGKIA